MFFKGNLNPEFLSLLGKYFSLLKCGQSEVWSAIVLKNTYVHIKLILEIVSQFEDAAREMADEVTKPRPLGEEEVQDIQITLKSDANPMSVRELRVYNWLL